MRLGYFTHWVMTCRYMPSVDIQGGHTWWRFLAWRLPWPSAMRSGMPSLRRLNRRFSASNFFGSFSRRHNTGAGPSVPQQPTEQFSWDWCIKLPCFPAPFFTEIFMTAFWAHFTVLNQLVKGPYCPQTDHRMHFLDNPQSTKKCFFFFYFFWVYFFYSHFKSQISIILQSFYSICNHIFDSNQHFATLSWSIFFRSFKKGFFFQIFEVFQNADHFESTQGGKKPKKIAPKNKITASSMSAEIKAKCRCHEAQPRAPHGVQGWGTLEGQHSRGRRNSSGTKQFFESISKRHFCVS